MEEQDRERRALPRCAEVEAAITVKSFERSKHLKPHGATVLLFRRRLHCALGPRQARAPILCAKTANGGHEGRSDVSTSKQRVTLVSLAVVVAATILGAPVASADPRFNDQSSSVRPDDRGGLRGPGALASSTAAESAVRPDDRPGPRGPGALPGGRSTIVVGPAKTFDWGDAAIGALSGMGFALLLVGLVVLTVVSRTKTRLSLR
jgi:hypothetical protein